MTIVVVFIRITVMLLNKSTDAVLLNKSTDAVLLNKNTDAVLLNKNTDAVLLTPSYGFDGHNRVCLFVCFHCTAAIFIIRKILPHLIMVGIRLIVWRMERRVSSKRDWNNFREGVVVMSS